MVAARRKKKPVARTAVEGCAFAVVVESLRGDFRVFGEALVGLRSEVTGVKTEVSSLRAEVHAGFERVDRELTSVKNELDGVKNELGLVKSAVLEHGRELREIRDRKVDRDEAAPAP